MAVFRDSSWKSLHNASLESGGGGSVLTRIDIQFENWSLFIHSIPRPPPHHPDSFVSRKMWPSSALLPLPDLSSYFTVHNCSTGLLLVCLRSKNLRCDISSKSMLKEIYLVYYQPSAIRVCFLGYRRYKTLVIHPGEKKTSHHGAKN
jgi:hypothetical protein